MGGKGGKDGAGGRGGDRGGSGQRGQKQGGEKGLAGAVAERGWGRGRRVEKAGKIKGGRANSPGPAASED